MIIKPKIRGFICTNAHPEGCAAHVQQQIDYVKSQGDIQGAPKNVLVIGASTGYGLSSRITAAFGGGANTVGIFFEKPATERRTGSAGWYNSAAFHSAAEEAGLYAASINGDAFSSEIKQQTIELLKRDMPKVDLVVYSLAAPRRTDPVTGELHSSSLKPIGQSYTAKTLDTDKLVVKDMTLEPANEEEIAGTIKVMGGEDWELWIDALKEADLLAEGAKTVAYTYIGKDVTKPVYWDATIGKAKEDLDRAAAGMRERLADIKGDARVGVLKALVTQSSSAIPIMPLYISLLYKVMKEAGTHEGTIEQIYGLFNTGMYGDLSAEVDEEQRYRLDVKELRDEIQDKVKELWPQVTTENYDDLSDYKGYHAEFLRMFGFGFDSVDYDADVNPVVPMKVEEA